MKNKICFDDIIYFDFEKIKANGIGDDELIILIKQYNTFMFLFNKSGEFPRLDEAYETLEYLNRSSFIFED